MDIRDATSSDAAEIARVHVASWRAGYDGLMAPEVLAGLDVEQRTEMWTGLLSGPSQGARFLAERDGEVIGFVIGATESPFAPGMAEVFSIYVDPGAWRSGAGSALLTGAVDALRTDGPRPVVLWVVDGNERAYRFYESHGFVLDGERKDEVLDGHTVAHVRFRLD